MPVRFELDSYSKSMVYAYWGDRWDRICSITPCPRGYSIRWYHLEHGVPGWMELADTLDAAKAIVEAWARGLEIEPWD